MWGKPAGSTGLEPKSIDTPANGSPTFLHNALAKEISPFSFVVFPLEKVADDLYQSRTRDASLRRFRLFATERERYWVGRLNSLWPQGFKSSYPGKPVSAWVQRSWRCPAPDRIELNEEEINEVGRQVSSWLKRLISEGSAALRETKNWDKAKLRETLDWIQAHVPQRERRANLSLSLSLPLSPFLCLSVSLSLSLSLGTRERTIHSLILRSGEKVRGELH